MKLIFTTFLTHFVLDPLVDIVLVSNKFSSGQGNADSESQKKTQKSQTRTRETA